MLRGNRQKSGEQKNFNLSLSCLVEKMKKWNDVKHFYLIGKKNEIMENVGCCIPTIHTH